MNKGQFVKVGDDLGVIVFLEFENETPEEHVSVWFGELSENGIPKYRTIPLDYCELVNEMESYH